MAITICSPTLPNNLTLPSIPIPMSSIKSLSHYNISSKHSLTLLSDNNSLVNIEPFLVCSEDCVAKEGEVEMRRRKRRRRKKDYLEIGNGEVDDDDDVEELLFVSNKCSLLSSRQEAELAMCFKDGEKLETIRRNISGSEEPEQGLKKQWAKSVGMKQRNLDRRLCKGRESREIICRVYKRLVVSVANGYQGRGLSLQDLIQEGSIGLLRGVEKFDPERGYKLSTYVYWWIRQAMSRAIANKSRVVRLPVSMCEMLAKIAEANTVLRTRLRRLATYDEIAQELNVRVSTVRLVSEKSRPPISLDAAATNRGCMTLQEIIAGPEETTPETMMKKQLKKQVVKKLLMILNEREASIIGLYYGLNGETPKSCEEIGRVLKLSRERVRQINVIAMSKLRQTSIIEDLKMYMI